MVMKFIVKSLLFLVVISVYGSAQEVGKVNGMSITKTEANEALKLLTSGKKRWSMLSKDEKKELITMMAPAKVIAAKAKKGLTQKEKESALANFWLQKETSKVSVSDEEAKQKYEEMKILFKKREMKKPLPAFETMKSTLKTQIAKERVVSKLMKKSKIQLKK
jgi:hypothetical protein